MSEFGVPAQSIAQIWESRKGYRDITGALKDSCNITRRHLGASCYGLTHKLENVRLLSRVNTFLQFSIFNDDVIAEEAPVICRVPDGVFELGRDRNIKPIVFDEGAFLWGIAYGVMTLAVPTAETNRIATQKGAKRYAAEIFSPVLLLDVAICYEPDLLKPGSFTATTVSQDVVGLPLEYDFECIGTIPKPPTS